MKRLIAMNGAPLFSAALLVAVPGPAWSQAAVTETPTNNGGSGHMPLPPKSGGGGGGGINSGARAAQAQQIIGIGMNAAMGAKFMAGCKSSAWWKCVLAGLSFAQAGLMASAAGGSGATAGASGLGPGGWTPPPNFDPNDPKTWPGSGLTPDQAAAFNDLKDKGYRIGPGGAVIAPDGRSFGPNDFASKDAMAAAGVPSGAIDGLASEMDRINADATKQAEAALNGGGSVVAMGLHSGGGGGRAPASWDDSSGNFDDYLDRLRNPFGMSVNQKQQMLAGKTVSHGNDQIGVKVDDIFSMVHRRYQEKRNDNEFVEPQTTAPAAKPEGKPSVVTPRRGR